MLTAQVGTQIPILQVGEMESQSGSRLAHGRGARRGSARIQTQVLLALRTAHRFEMTHSSLGLTASFIYSTQVPSDL